MTDNDGATHSVTTTATISAANTGGSIANACSTEGPTREGSLFQRLHQTPEHSLTIFLYQQILYWLNLINVIALISVS